MAEETETKNKTDIPKNTPPANKVSLAVWVLLFSAAFIVDAAQAGLDALTLGIYGVVGNILVDIVVGFTLTGVFWKLGILDKKLFISLMLAAFVDFATLGIAPTWLADILYAWFLNSGTKAITNIPGLGEKTKEAVEKTVSKGKL